MSLAGRAAAKQDSMSQAQTPISCASLAKLLATVDGALALRDHELRLFFAPHDRAWEELRKYQLDVAALKQDGWDRALKSRRCRVLVTGWGTPAVAPELTTLGGGSIDYICHLGGAIRQVVSREMIASGLLVSNWGTTIAPLVAEHALLLILAALRNLPYWPTYMRQWAAPTGKDVIATRSLRSKKVGLYGLGAIARELVAHLRPFSVEISAFSAGVPSALFAESGVKEAESLRALCHDSDVLVCCEALLPRTKHSLNRETLGCLPRGAVFVNVARGPIVDEGALLEVARDRELRLGLDVFSCEPLPMDSPLFSLPGTVLSPHIAGPTHDFYGNCGDYAVANIARYAKGERPESQVTAAIYDRAT